MVFPKVCFYYIQPIKAKNMSNLYKELEVNNYIKEAVLKEHCFYNKKFMV